MGKYNWGALTPEEIVGLMLAGEDIPPSALLRVIEYQQAELQEQVDAYAGLEKEQNANHRDMEAFSRGVAEQLAVIERAVARIEEMLPS